MAEKILAAKSGREYVKPGEILDCRVDLAMTHDATVKVLPVFQEMGGEKVWDPEKIVIPIDHWVPAGPEKTAENQLAIRRFVREQSIRHFYDVKEGICHQVLVEKGHVLHFRGRMGSSEAQVYLASPATVAASAVAGYITSPEVYLK